jgi:hypothetical protein
MNPPALLLSSSRLTLLNWRRYLVAIGFLYLASTALSADLPGEGPVRSRPLSVPTEGRPGFTRLDPAVTRLAFTNFVPESRHLTNQLLLDGGGVTASDIDGDGRVDAFFAGLSGSSRLWRNQGGFQFEDITASAFNQVPGFQTWDVTGCVFADLNADAAPDLVLSTHGQGTWVLINDGRGKFTALPPLNPGRGGHSIAVADVDGDGWLDLYLVNYRVRALMDMPNARATFRVVNGRTEVATVDGRPTSAPDLTNRFTVNLRGGVEELGEPDVLYRNLDGSRFEEVPWTNGAWVDADGEPLAQPPFDWGLAALFRDLDGDGRPELFVSNDFQSPDRLWRNESSPGRIRFRLAPPGTFRHTSRFSMGADFADVNRDGLDDLVVLDMLSRSHEQRLTQLEGEPPSQIERSNPAATPQHDVNVLQLGRPDGSFAEVAAFTRLQASEWSWTPAFLDVDLDGWDDLLITTGQWRAARDLDVAANLRRLRQTRRMSDAELFAARRQYPKLDPPQVAFRNEGGRFREVGAEWGWNFNGVAHGLCLADLDEDGDLDLLVNLLNGPAAVLRNETSAPRLAVRLAGAPPNRHGIGARIRVRPANQPAALPQSQEMMAGGRYLSGDAPLRVFSAAGAERWSIEVRWPNGQFTRVPDAQPNRLYELHPDPAAPPPATASDVAIVTPWFDDLSSRLNHSHRTEDFDDFIRQPLLPRLLSTEGPGVTWADLDGDGTEELVLPGGFNGALEIFKVSTDSSFTRIHQIPVVRPQPMALPWAGKLLLAESSYTDGSARGAAVSLWPQPGPALEAGPNAVATLAAADVTGDGSLELFVGARVIPGQWPRPPLSALVRIDTNGFKLLQVVTNAGLVRSAVFSDLDLDGDPDLAVAAEWAEPRFFRNEAGVLSPWIRPFLLDGQPLQPGALAGNWTAIHTGDFNSDGRQDVVLGNHGENTYLELFGLPLVVAHGDLDNDGTHDVFLGYHPPPIPSGAVSSTRRPDPVLQPLHPVHGLSVLAPAIPLLRERFKSHRSFATSHLAEVLGPAGAAFPRLTNRWNTSILLLNHPTHWEVRRLPDPAQLSPVQGIAVADWDGDGAEDLFLTQNFFGHNHGWTRDDAGLGLILRGDGHGNFTPVDPAESGVRIPGEGRAAAMADFNADGRPDVVVTQHAGPTRVFRNTLAKPGVRVALDGPPGNPFGIGARIRWIAGDRSGPSREWHLGAGNGACDSTIQILALPDVPNPDWIVTWPGGREQRLRIPPDTRSIRIRPEP